MCMNMMWTSWIHVATLRAPEPLSNGLPRFGYSAKDILVVRLRPSYWNYPRDSTSLTHHARYCLEIHVLDIKQRS